MIVATANRSTPVLKTSGPISQHHSQFSEHQTRQLVSFSLSLQLMNIHFRAFATQKKIEENSRTAVSLSSRRGTETDVARFTTACVTKVLILKNAL